jgi:hypothetical protein
MAVIKKESVESSAASTRTMICTSQPLSMSRIGSRERDPSPRPAKAIGRCSPYGASLPVGRSVFESGRPETSLDPLTIGMDCTLHFSIRTNLGVLSVDLFESRLRVRGRFRV